MPLRKHTPTVGIPDVHHGAATLVPRAPFSLRHSREDELQSLLVNHLEAGAEKVEEVLSVVSAPLDELEMVLAEAVLEQHQVHEARLVLVETVQEEARGAVLVHGDHELDVRGLHEQAVA